MDDMDDPELAAAIEASYNMSGVQLPGADEDELLAQAIAMSRLDEARRGASSSCAPEVSEVTGRSRVLPSGGQSAMDHDRMSDIAVAGGSEVASSRDLGSPRHDEEMQDRDLARAIEASYASQTDSGQLADEADLVAQALRISKMEDESRARVSLREQQEQELEESLLMDQMRAQEEKRRRLEEQEEHVLQASSQEEAARKLMEEERRKAQEQAVKRARVPPEPPADDSSRVDLMIRFPSGSRMRRAFRATNSLSQVFDYIDVDGDESLASQSYRLVCTMPRCVFERDEKTLSEAGLKGQCALLVELVEPFSPP